MSTDATPTSLPLDYANLDFGRAKRVGFPETIYGLGKTPAQIAGIFARLCDAHPRVLCTRCSPEAAKLSLVDVPQAQYDEVTQVLYRADLSVPVLRLAASGATGSGWRLCTEAEGCRELEALLSTAGRLPDWMEIRPGPCAAVR